MTEAKGSTAIDLDLVGSTEIDVAKEDEASLRRRPITAITTHRAGAFAFTSHLGPQGVPCPHGLLWDLATGQQVEGLWTALHPDESLALRPMPEGADALCDIASGEPVTTKARPPELAPGPSRMSADDGSGAPSVERIAVWSFAEGRLLEQAVPPHRLWERLPGGRIVLVGERGAVSVWDVATATLVGTMKAAQQARPVRLRVAPDGRTALTVTKKGETALWDLAAMKLVAAGETLRIEYGSGELDMLELLPDGRSLLVASKRGVHLVSKTPGVVVNHFLGVLDAANGAVDNNTWTTVDKGYEIHALSLAAGSSRLAMLIDRSGTGSGPTRLEMWDLDQRLLVGAVETRSRLLAVAPNGRAAVAGSRLSMGRLSRQHVSVYRAVPRPDAALPTQPLRDPGRPADDDEEPDEPAPPPKKKGRKSAKK